MVKGFALVLAAVLASADSATAMPWNPFDPARDLRAFERPAQPDGGQFILAQGRGGSGGQRGGGGGQRAAGGTSRGNFNSNSFHGDVSNTRNRSATANRNVNASSNRNVNATANRNVNVNGGGSCCYGDYNSGPSWGGVAAGVAAGAVLGAAGNSAASSPTYATPPPTYPPGYVTPPPY